MVADAVVADPVVADAVAAAAVVAEEDMAGAEVGASVEDADGVGAVVTELGGVDDDALADDGGVTAELATPGVEVLHPIITAIEMIAKRATNEERTVVFIFFAST